MKTTKAVRGPDSPSPLLACAKAGACYASPMQISNYLVEEALSLPAPERAEFAQLLVDSLREDTRTDDEIRAALQARLDDLKSGRDPGLSFDEVFAPRG
jgi:putative addiction module component (TIGR02574 family)